jgi:hypothetical protein
VEPGVTSVGGGGGPALWIFDSQPASATMKTRRTDPNLADIQYSFTIQLSD